MLQVSGILPTMFNWYASTCACWPSHDVRGCLDRQSIFKGKQALWVPALLYTEFHVLVCRPRLRLSDSKPRLLGLPQRAPR